MDDGLQARRRAIAAIDAVLAGRVTKPAELAPLWPRSVAGDPLVTRAHRETVHFLMVGGELERAIVGLLRRFLEEGGAPDDLDRAYDALIHRRTRREGPAG